MSDLSTVISIVTRLPPAIDGVGDYALNLARQLRKDYNIQTQFIVGNPDWKGEAEIAGFSVNQVTDSNSDQLTTLFEGDRTSPVLLHYVGYGYAKRGCPIWLVDGMQRWKNLYPDRLLVTMFHELCASSYLPWQSSFWLSPLQKSLVTRLAKLSDRCITSKQSYSDILVKLSNGKHKQIQALPVFSNVGEPKQNRPLSDRQKQLVIFGSVANRIRVYRESQEALNSACQSLDIQSILDLGTPTGIEPQTIGNVPILELGMQPAEKISEIMADAIAGFLNYNPNFLSKSGIFAAYCAHGLLPINVRGSDIPIDKIKLGEHYWISSKVELKDIERMQAISNNAHAWYSSHNLSSQSKIFFHILNTEIQLESQ
ncbi:glycosyltransferase family 1 protein [Pseudanabaena sp. UWO311]|uniref:glycosyltransferase family 1 protein n=1 Tax=Pseudanabaena sp. UWO311 TaxID=2487337 RepID=UPI00115A74B6|nr:glycosyltransferase family 1 protein [Pseudanabaena sp. UWO311]TYQ23359.1 glycosyltransferase family 1 protein [Pseudanabaena sp. UWO311]